MWKLYEPPEKTFKYLLPAVGKSTTKAAGKRKRQLQESDIK
jgi:hypothetical protein